MFVLLLAQIALAGQVYVNGTLVNPGQIAGTTLEKVDVTFDAAGNIRVSAPGYKIEVMDPTGAGAASTGYPPAPQAGTYPQPYPQPAAGAYPPPAPAVGSYPPPAYPPPAAAATSAYGAAPGLHPSGVAKATWWLVVEDNGSVGHTVEVIVNDQLAQTVRSGEPVRILDVGGYLRPGANKILVKSNSVGAGGGSMYVYVGSGSDRSGTVVMDAPQVQFGLGASRNGPYEREYSIQVP